MKTTLTQIKLNELEEGDIVQSKHSGLGYIVIGTSSGYVIAVRPIRISNEDEWFKINKEK